MSEGFIHNGFEQPFSLLFLMKSRCFEVKKGRDRQGNRGPLISKVE